jgi:hypothetical protein
VLLFDAALVWHGYLQLLFESCKAGLQRFQQLACGIDPFRLQQPHHSSAGYNLVLFGNMLVDFQMTSNAATGHSINKHQLHRACCQLRLVLENLMPAHQCSCCRRSLLMCACQHWLSNVQMCCTS